MKNWFCPRHVIILRMCVSMLKGRVFVFVVVLLVETCVAGFWRADDSLVIVNQVSFWACLPIVQLMI